MKKLLPLILVLVGIGGGVGAGIALKPAPDPEAEPETIAPEAEHDYVKLNNQFVIPVVTKGRVTSMVILSLSLETAVGASETVYAREPKLRDSFLQVLFEHANTGGFQGSFTDSGNLIVLRRSLLEAAQLALGTDVVSDVLIVDIMRQDS